MLRGLRGVPAGAAGAEIEGEPAARVKEVALEPNHEAVVHRQISSPENRHSLGKKVVRAVTRDAGRITDLHNLFGKDEPAAKGVGDALGGQRVQTVSNARREQ